ncbi:uncharacterized protein [Salvelinus alpinus]|uniref:uncharacterized protein isoform X2 n=1 Tax=Salvelinus alpinus TaxID=8036 RepID=UPI0039FC5B63
MTFPLLPTAGSSQMRVNHKVKVFPPSEMIFLAQQTCYEDWAIGSLEYNLRDQVPENPANRKEIPKNSYMSVAAVFVVVGSLAIGLLLLKLFQARRLRQHESLIPEDSVVPEDHRSRDTSHQSSQGHIPSELAGTHPTRARRDTSHQSSQGHIPPELTGTHPTRARRDTSHQTSQGHIPPELTGTHPTRAPRDTSHQTSQGHIPPELTGTHPTRARRDTSRQSSQEQGHIPSVIKHLTRVRFRSC